jgi:putative flippase GtrA
VGQSRPRTRPSRVRRFVTDRRVAFLLVGGFNVVQGVGWFALFHALLGEHLPYLAVLVLAYVPSILIGFWLYRTLVFKVEGQVFRDLVRFTLVQSTALLINLVSLPFFHEVLDLPLLLSQGISVVVIVVFNYVGHLSFSFRRSHGHPDAGRLLEPEAVTVRRERR